MPALSHRIGRLLFGFGVGIVVAVTAYRCTVPPDMRAERAAEEAAVLAARAHLERVLGESELVIVDPLAPDRRAGKAYVYRSGDGWQVSGFYRRDEADLWHPFLMDLDREHGLVHLKLSDRALLQRDGEPGLEVLP
ncbi:MAG: hypothetical protein R3176_01690 [Woeseiaceae bacterium]|nr:hypothetical protein [Woeseiaceae bacterium]